MAMDFNTIIGFDNVNSTLKIMRVVNATTNGVKVETIPLAEGLSTGDYVSALESTLKSYSGLSSLAQTNAALVLPNNMVCLDFVSIPIMKKKRMEEAIKVEIMGLFRNYEDLQTNSVVLSSNRMNASYLISATDKTIVNALRKTLSTYKVEVKLTTYTASATANAALQLRPKIRKSNFIFADIRQDSTEMVVCMRDRIVGSMTLPYGYNILSADRVYSEVSLYDHDVAELAVLNAVEIAKAKKLTISAEDFEANLDDIPETDAPADENSVDGVAQPSDDEDEPALPTKVIVDDEDDEEEEEEPEGETTISEAVAMKKKGKVFVRKVQKRLPMFMQRPTPETAEGFIRENFRVLEKRMLLCKKQCDLDDRLMSPDFILVNMPSEYEFIIDSLNLDKEESGIEFRYFDPKSENNAFVTDNLDLFGALFSNNLNRNMNF